MKKIILILLLLPLIASAQSFNVFDIDTSEYPIMKAKFYSIDENGDQILNHTTSDFEITENGNPAEVLSVSCPDPKTEPVSFVIAVDVSGSMSGEEIVTLKNSLKYFIDLVTNDGSEVAIIAFNSGNHYISDFTQNKSKLKSRVDALSASGGTDFDAAFINPVAGALLAMEKAKHTNRNVILITDGMANGDENAIISKAKSLGTKVFGMLIKNKAPVLLKNIFNETGGKSFENIITGDDYQNTFLILNQLIGNAPCEINWNSNLICEGILAIELTNRTLGIKTSLTQYLNSYQYLSIDIDNYFIDFGTNSTDTTITITANNGTQIINDMVFVPDNGDYQIVTQLPVTIPTIGSMEIELKFTAEDDSRVYTKMEILGDYCNTSIGLLKGDKDKPLTKKTLKLTHPNGGEQFVAGSDTTITWEGISKSEQIDMNFSLDNGGNWLSINSNVEGNEYEWNLPITKSDSCLIIINQSESNLKTTERFIEWEKNYGGSEFDIASSIIQTKEGGYIIVGNSTSDDGDLTRPEGGWDYWIIKINSVGELEWEKTFGGSSSEYANSIIQSEDGGYIIAGSTGSTDGSVAKNKGSFDYWILKLNAIGELEWEKTFGGTKSDRANSISQTKDGGFIIAGYSSSNDGDISNAKGLRDYWIVKINSIGELEWGKSFGGSLNEEAHSIIQTSDDGYIVAGQCESVDGDITNAIGDYDYWIIKLNAIGELEWEKSFGGILRDVAKSIIETKNGEYLVVGNSFTKDISEFPELNGASDILIIKLNSIGDIQWEKSIGGSYEEIAEEIKPTKDNGYIIAGYTNSIDGNINKNYGNYDVWVVKINSIGEIEWSSTYGGSEGDYANSIVQVLDGGFCFAGTSKSKDINVANNYGNNDFWVAKLSPPPIIIQSDTSDAVFSIIMPEPMIQNNDINMGEMIVGNTKDTIVSSVICNTGDAPLHVLGVDITGGDAADFLIPRGAGDFYLQKDECQDMMFEFTPSALGIRTAVATIRTTIGDFTDTINIRGVGINPLIEATTDVVDFGQFELGDGKDTNVVLIKNVGADDITITETKITGPDTEQFDMVPLPSFTLATGDDKELELNYTARYGGRTSSIIEFHYDGIGSPLRSMLFAEGIGGEVYPQVPDAYVGDRVELGLYLGRIKPEGLDEVATNFTATVSYNSTLLAPIDKNMSVTTENTTSFIEIEGQLSGVSQIATVPMKVGLGTAVKSGLVVTEFQLYDANGDSVDYEIEPGVGEFNVLGICEEGGTRLVNPNSEKVGLRVAQNRQNTSATIYLDLIESGQTDLIIYGQLGNAVETAYSGTTNAGSKELSLDLSNYTNGRYYIKLTTPTITKTEIIEVVR